MEQLLIKMARQLDAIDESSLSALWEKYSFMASHFEPSKRWEESVLVLSLIQAKRWKNQLFNQQWAARCNPERPDEASRITFTLETEDKEVDRPKAKVLTFKPRSSQTPENGND